MKIANWLGLGPSDLKRVFSGMAVPVTTANERIIKSWREEMLWKPFQALTQDFAETSPEFQELIQSIHHGRKKISTNARRGLLQRFVDQRIPGYKVIYEAEFIDGLNKVLAEKGDTQRVLGFRYGKDGRGAMPDRYYHMLFCDRKLMVGNHHDILGHFALLAYPENRRLTEELSTNFLAALDDQYRLNNLPPAIRDSFQKEIQSLSRVLRLYTLSWNMIQEKLYLRVKNRSGKTVLNMIGAFNSVYNPIFSSSLPRESVGQVAGAIGFFNQERQRSIIMSPTEVKDFFQASEENQSQELQLAFSEYEKIWQSATAGRPVTTRDLAIRMSEIVNQTLHSPTRRLHSIRSRWLSFSDRILSDSLLANFFDSPTLMKFGEATMKIGAAQHQQVLANARAAEILRPTASAS